MSRDIWDCHAQWYPVGRTQRHGKASYNMQDSFHNKDPVVYMSIVLYTLYTIPNYIYR